MARRKKKPTFSEWKMVTKSLIERNGLIFPDGLAVAYFKQDMSPMEVFSRETRRQKKAPSNDRVEGRDACGASLSHAGLCGNGSEVGVGDTAVDIAKAPDIHSELTLAAFYREVAK